MKKKKFDDGSMGVKSLEAGCGHIIDARQVIYVHLFQDGKEIAIETRCPKCIEGLVDYKK